MLPLLLSVCIDAVTDPLVGGWTDNLRSEMGRRRPFIFFAPIFVAVAAILNGCPPEGVDYGVWYGLFTILFFVLDDVYQAPVNPNRTVTRTVHPNPNPRSHTTP